MVECDLMDVMCIQPGDLSIQNLYLGEQTLVRLGLKVGDIVLIKNSLICRIFLHRIREITGLIIETGVYKDSKLFPTLQYNLTDKKLNTSDLERQTTMTANSISVTIVVNRKQTFCDTQVVRDILYNICFVDETTVHTQNNITAKLFDIAAIHIKTDVSNPGNVFKITDDTEITIRKVYTRKYLTCMRNNELVPPIAGVHKIYNNILWNIEQRNQHILISGPTGAGKSCLISRLSADLGYPLLTVDCSDLGTNIESLEEAFKEANDMCNQNNENPGAIILLTDVDAAGGKKGIHQLQGVSRIQKILEETNQNDDNMIIIGTTSRPASVHQNLRRPGRFGLEFFIKVPSEDERLEMLNCILDHALINIQEETKKEMAISTRGFLAADLALLANRIKLAGSEDWSTIQKCIEQTIPSGLKLGLGYVNLEKVSWDSIGGMEEIKQKLIRAIDWPIRRPDAFKRLGIKPSKGVLLYGPPGCGKTRLVRAVASNTGATLLSVSGAEIFSPYVGDSEKAIVELFRQARLGAPTILFIDEIDTLVSSRETGSSKTPSSHKVLSALLTEMDGMGSKEQESIASGQVLVVGATNRPGSLDSALTRPGRLDTLLYIPPPDLPTRIKIFETYLTNVPHTGINIQTIAHRCENFSGADLENLIKESVLHLLSKEGLDSLELREEHVLSVLEDYRPSLTNLQLKEYEALQFS